MKTNAIIRIVIFCLLIVLLLSILVVGIGFRRYAFHWNSGFSTAANAQQSSSGQVPASEIRNLNIEWVSGSVTVQPGDTDQIQFSESGNFSEDQQMVWYQSGDTLTIQFGRTQAFFGIHVNSDKDLVVTVPRGHVFQELEIDSVSARIDVSDQTAEEMDLENVSGTCFYQNCDTRKMTADTVSGNVTYTGRLEVLKCNTVSADCTLKAVNEPQSLTLDGVSGNLILELPADCGFTADMDSLSGTISSDFETTVSKHRHSHGEGNCQISASTTSGCIFIRKAS